MDQEKKIFKLVASLIDRKYEIIIWDEDEKSARKNSFRPLAKEVDPGDKTPMMPHENPFEDIKKTSCQRLILNRDYIIQSQNNSSINIQIDSKLTRISLQKEVPMDLERGIPFHLPSV